MKHGVEVIMNAGVIIIHISPLTGNSVRHIVETMTNFGENKALWGLSF